MDNKLHLVSKSQVDHYLEEQNQMHHNQLVLLYLEELKLKGQSQQVHYLGEHSLMLENQVDHYLEVHKLMLKRHQAHFSEELNQTELNQLVNFSELNQWQQVVHSLGELKIIIAKYLVAILNLQLHYLLQVQEAVFLELKHLVLQVALVEVVLCLVVVKHLINLVDPYLDKPTICLINLLMPPKKNQSTVTVNLKKMKITSLLMNLLQSPSATQPSTLKVPSVN